MKSKAAIGTHPIHPMIVPIPIGAFFLAQPSQVWQVLGSLLFLLSTIMDGCDGEIARLTFQESEFGAKNASASLPRRPALRW